MIKPTVFTIVLLTLAMLTTIDSDGAEPPPLPSGRRIRTIVADKYPDGNVYIGGTTGWRKRAAGSGIILDREFSYATPENDFKQSYIHPKPGVWNWINSDAWIIKCAKEKQVLRLHCPISPQCSKWAKDDSRTAKELKRNLAEYTVAVYKRYDRYKLVKWIDVVNETVTGKGRWNGAKAGTDKWECPWIKIGIDETHPLKPPLYIKFAFQIATKYAPNTKLIINQHGGMDDAIWDKIKGLVLYLREQGLRVDGIGWQAHIDVGWEKQDNNLQRLSDLIDWAHTHKLSFHVTEQNVWLKNSPKDLNAQADTFAAVLRTVLEKRNSGVVSWNTWNLSDRDIYQKKAQFEGCIFDREFKPKPAYYAIQKLLENPPAVNQPL